METLLAAASREDELVAKLLLAFARNDHSAYREFAAEIARNRGRSPGDAKSRNTEIPETDRSTLSIQGVYQDKLLESRRREEILLEALVTAVANGELFALPSLCRNLVRNRKVIEPKMNREKSLSLELSP